jgi:hypothetical protein
MYLDMDRYKIKIVDFRLRRYQVTISELYPTEGWDVAWNPREMGSTWVGGMREGPAPQAESKKSS